MIYNANGVLLPPSYDIYVKGVAHRGLSSVAPENTAIAYKMAKQVGFHYVETDIRFTSDNVPVCIHDATIDRTSDGTGNVNAMTYQQLLTYDFGSWKSSDYAGTKILSLVDFLALCRGLGLHPYIELKSTVNTQYQIFSDLVKNSGLGKNITILADTTTYLNFIKSYVPSARLGLVVQSITDSVVTAAQGLQTSDFPVFLDSSSYTQSEIDKCVAGGLPLEVYTIDAPVTIAGLPTYITGVTSNSAIAGKVLYDAYRK